MDRNTRFTAVESAAALVAFQRILALVVCAEYWTKAIRDRTFFDLVDAVSLVAVSLLAVAIVTGRGRRRAFVGLALLQAWWIWRYFPNAGNHRYLELFLCVAFAALDTSDSLHAALQLRCVRVLSASLLFYAGLQKLVWGHWTSGTYLAFASQREPFRATLAPLFPAAELERLAAFAGEVGDGPYLVDAPWLVVTSNLVWICELGLAALLLLPATRAPAWRVACVLILAIQLVAREFMFGIEFCAALALFDDRDRLSRWVAPAALLLATLVLVRAVFPRWIFF
ncbi:MAG: hypothetical protein GY716_16585 [bacterium]|nr:hypothetical protein [bacterium]